MNLSFFGKLRRLALQFLTIIAPVAMLSACGGGGSGPDTLVSPPSTQGTLSITLAAAATSLNGGDSTTLTATVTDSSGKAVAGQSVTLDFGSNLSGATLSSTSSVSDSAGKASVRYTAGSNAGTDSIIATVTDSNSKTASASVGIIVASSSSGSTLRVTLSAASTSLNGGASTALTAAVTDSAGAIVSGQSVTFDFGTNLSGATLSATSGTSDNTGKAGVLYTAGSKAGSDSIIATVTDSNGRTASSSVAITVTSNSTGSTLKVALTASKTTLNTSEDTELTAMVTNADGSIASGKTVSFGFGSNLSEASLSATSAISGADGKARIRYTAGTKSGMDTVFASVTDAANKTTESSVTITVTAAQAVVGSVSILSSNSTIGTNSTPSVDLIVQVKSASNILMTDVPVVLTADKGTLLISNSVTDASGSVVAKLSTAGLYDNTQITVNASANGIPATPLVVNVSGTTIVLTGPSSAEMNTAAPFSLLLKDANDKPIIGKAVALTTTSGALSASSVTTDATGQASFTLNTGITATITATSLGATTTATLSVANTSIEITAPTADAFVNINEATPVTARVRIAGVLAVGAKVTFSTTRGTLTKTSETTDKNGVATVSIQSTTSGPATITASYDVDGSGKNVIAASQAVTFTAPTATRIVMQADPSVVNVNSPTTITAILRDDAYNIVANKTVTFSILEDSSNGSLSSSTATSDANGRASVTFNAGATATANNGVRIEARADKVTNTATLTVGGQSLFVRMGTDEKIYVSSPNVYQTFSILVTDSAGLPRPGAQVSLKALPIAFYKGVWSKGVIEWILSYSTTTPKPCLSEDLNNNGIYDAGEDLNGNGVLDPGNVATIVFKNGVNITDSNGFAYADVYFAQSYGIWVDVNLIATAKVVGSEGTAQTDNYILPVRADLVNNVNGPAPSASPSPWGSSNSCYDVK
ncbi:MAG: Ig-like domain-containing protein [Halothiobacillaceae bacterium]|nr:Ig-like domain-containing protein [Halothiobacillaceae bacterium]